MNLAKTLAVAVTVLTVQGAAATELITNGGFESGLTGWTVTDLPGGSGSWFGATGTTTPVSSQTTVGPASGTGYAVSDQTGPGTHALTQSFIVAPGASSVLLSFSMFVDSYGGFSPNGGVLDHTGPATQFGRVDLLAGSATAFDVGAGVLSNFFLGVDAGTIPNPYTAYSFDITALVAGGGTFQLRFAESDNQLFLNMGVDNVSVAATAVPEPASLSLLGLGLFGLAAARRRRTASAA